MASAAPIATQSSDGSLATTSDGSVVKEAGMQAMTDEQWAALLRDGYVSLGTTASPEEVKALRSRVHDIMMGKVRYDDALLMQLDPSAPDSSPSSATTATTTTTAGDTAAKDAAAAEYHKLGVESSGQTIGWKGPTVNYRKIGEAGNGLECDDLFMKFMRKPIFHDACKRAYGAHAAISVYRAMVMNKPAKRGTYLPWHQDGGEWWALDRDPLIFVWTALEDVTAANGCVQVVPGTHKLGLLSRRGHTLSDANIDKLCGTVVNLEAVAGESFLCHNFLVHRSGVNSTDKSRIGFSANYVDQRTRVCDPKPKLAGSIGVAGQHFPLVFPSPFAEEQAEDATE